MASGKCVDLSPDGVALLSGWNDLAQRCTPSTRQPFGIHFELLATVKPADSQKAAELSKDSAKILQTDGAVPPDMLARLQTRSKFHLIRPARGEATNSSQDLQLDYGLLIPLFGGSVQFGEDKKELGNGQCLQIQDKLSIVCNGLCLICALEPQAEGKP